ncbi:MAG TPA: response regulator [Methanobacterium sp.]|nr:response regulator [Methanobacterium sp.]
MKPIKILIVEDNQGDARLITEMLKEVSDLDFDVSHAMRLDEGLKYLITKEFDVIFLDLCLPDSEGIETFNIMNYNSNDTPIIVLSGLEDEIYAISAVGRGAEEYLVKGKIDSQTLVRSVKQSLKIS